MKYFACDEIGPWLQVTMNVRGRRFHMQIEKLKNQSKKTAGLDILIPKAHNSEETFYCVHHWINLGCLSAFLIPEKVFEGSTMSFVSDWMPSLWDISFKTERDLSHDPAQVAKNAHFGDFDMDFCGFIEGFNTVSGWQFFHEEGTSIKNGNHAPKNLICFWCHVRNVT